MSTGGIVAAVAVGLLVLVLGGALLAGGLGTTTVTSFSDEGTAQPWTPPPADGSFGLVVGTYKTKAGLSIFGLGITPGRWEAQVTFVPPPGCTPSESEDVVATGACAGIPAEGKYAGGGTDMDGSTLLTVAFEVSRACHEVLEFGDHWPTTKPECAD